MFYNVRGMSKTKLKFKDAMLRLEQIATELESDDVDVDVALKKYAEGIELIQSCREKLTAAENTMKEIRADASSA